MAAATVSNSCSGAVSSTSNAAWFTVTVRWLVVVTAAAVMYFPVVPAIPRARVAELVEAESCLPAK